MMIIVKRRSKYGTGLLSLLPLVARHLGESRVQLVRDVLVLLDLVGELVLNPVHLLLQLLYRPLSKLGASFGLHTHKLDVCRPCGARSRGASQVNHTNGRERKMANHQIRPLTVTGHQGSLVGRPYVCVCWFCYTERAVTHTLR